MENLRKKPTYNELINYLEFEQPKIKFPDRRATFLRNSPYLTQFDGQSWIDLEKQENEINKEKVKEVEVRRLATEEGATAQAVRATQKPNIFDRPEPEAVRTSLTQRQAPKLNVSMLFDTGYDSGVDAYMSDMEEEQQRTLDENVRRLNAMKSMGSRAVSEASAPEERDYGFLMTPQRPSAPPETTYNTPVAPRNLEEEFKSPPSNTKLSESATKLMKNKMTEIMQKRADEARAKAKAKKEEEHKKRLEELSQPYQTSASSSSQAKKDDDEETRLDETSRDNLSQKQRKVYWKHVIAYSDDMDFWKSKDKSVADLKYQFHLRGKSDLLPDENDYKAKGKGRSSDEITYKQAILLVIESQIKKKKWDTKVAASLLEDRMESWKNKGKGKGS